MKRFVTSALVSALLGLASSQTMAGYTTFDGEDANSSTTVPLTATPNSSGKETDFLALLKTGVGTETFEGFAEGTAGPLPLSFPGATPGLVATLSGGDGVIGDAPPGTAVGGGEYSIPPGRRFWDVEVFSNTALANTFEIRFNRAVAAFGFYGIDVGDFGGRIALDLLNDKGGTIGTLTPQTTQGDLGSSSGSVMFFGAVADAASDDIWGIRFRFTVPLGSDVFAFDNFTIAERAQLVNPNGGGGPLPLPGTVALLGATLLGLGATARRKA